jgi:hypothetical protein
MRGTTAVAAVALAALLVLLGGPALAGPSLHDHPAPTPTTAIDPHAGHAGHAGHQAPVAAIPEDGVDGARLVVLGGFGLLNAAVIGTALVLRRTGHGRRTAVVR